MTRKKETRQDREQRVDNFVPEPPRHGRKHKPLPPMSPEAGPGAPE